MWGEGGLIQGEWRVVRGLGVSGWGVTWETGVFSGWDWDVWLSWGVWDGDWVELGCLYALTLVAEGVALEGRRGGEVHCAVLVQRLAELFA